MKYINAFKPIRSKSDKIEYSEKIIEAVLNPRIKGLNINMNDGWDYIDRKYMYIKLLLQRGQVSAIKTGQDLLASKDYLEVLTSGKFVNLIFETRESKKNTAYASENRIKEAQKTVLEYVQSKIDIQNGPLTGRVIYFSKLSGEGMIKCHELDRTLQVYACNLKGAKTGFAESACVYLNEGDEVEFKLSNGFVVGIQGHFDEERWNNLDQDRLSFKKNEDGTFKNGLF